MRFRWPWMRKARHDREMAQQARESEAVVMGARLALALRQREEEVKSLGAKLKAREAIAPKRPRRPRPRKVKAK